MDRGCASAVLRSPNKVLVGGLPSSLLMHMQPPPRTGVQLAALDHNGCSQSAAERNMFKHL